MATRCTSKAKTVPVSPTHRARKRVSFVVQVEGSNAPQSFAQLLLRPPVSPRNSTTLVSLAMS